MPAPPAPPSPPPSAPLNYAMQSSGSCTNYVMSMSECSAAAAALGLSDTTAASDGQPNGVSYDPPYCYFEGGSLKFNAGANTGSCTASDQCVSQLSPYELLSSGSCANYVTSMSACSTAAAALGLSDTTAADDNQPNGVSYDPP